MLMTVDDEKKTLLHHAAENGHMAIFDLWKRFYNTVEDQVRAEEKQLNPSIAIKALLTGFTLGAIDLCPKHPLSLINEQDSRRRAPLHSAALNNHENVVKWILYQWFPKPSAIDGDGKTADELATEKGHHRVAKIIKDAREGKYPWHEAWRTRNDDESESYSSSTRYHSPTPNATSNENNFFNYFTQNAQQNFASASTSSTNNNTQSSTSTNNRTSSTAPTSPPTSEEGRGTGLFNNFTNFMFSPTAATNVNIRQTSNTTAAQTVSVSNDDWSGLFGQVLRSVFGRTRRQFRRTRPRIGVRLSPAAIFRNTPTHRTRGTQTEPIAASQPESSQLQQMQAKIDRLKRRLRTHDLPDNSDSSGDEGDYRGAETSSSASTNRTPGAERTIETELANNAGVETTSTQTTSNPGTMESNLGSDGYYPGQEEEERLLEQFLGGNVANDPLNREAANNRVFRPPWYRRLANEIRTTAGNVQRNLNRRIDRHSQNRRAALERRRNRTRNT